MGDDPRWLGQCSVMGDMTLGWGEADRGQREGQDFVVSPEKLPMANWTSAWRVKEMGREVSIYEAKGN